jgi:pimeloyl-ACP methyl ester carboxylesterase
MSFVGPRLLNNPNPADLIVEGEAEVLHNSKEQLPQITAPTLIVAGERDYFCPTKLLRETALGIANARLITYQGKGHEPLGKPFQRDLLDFLVGQHHSTP